MRNFIILLSGGFDSAVMFCDLLRTDAQDGDNFFPVYVMYDNKHENEEMECANKIVKHVKEAYEGIDIECIIHPLRVTTMCGASSPITDGREHGKGKVFPKEYVPYRNASLVLSALSSVHRNVGCRIHKVYLATNKDDVKNMFPDCGTRFQDLMNSLLSLYEDEPGDNRSISLELPYCNKTKAEIALIWEKHLKGREEFPDFEKCVFSGYTDGDPAPAIHASMSQKAKRDTEELLKNVESRMASVSIPMVEEAFRKHDEVCPATSLMTKEHEPLIIRKFTQYGFPLYVALICGANLNNLDEVVHGFLQPMKKRIQTGGIQNMRNIVGELSEHITEAYGLKIEGVAVIWYVDKMMVSSLYGDFMTHTSCRIELYSLLQMSCHV